MNNYQGDLTDILRASGGVTQDCAGNDWQFSSNNQAINFSSSMEVSIQENFGNPFSNMQDPLLNELDIVCPSYYFNSSNSSEIISSSVEHLDLDVDFGRSGGNNMVAADHQETILEDEMKTIPSCNNMFSQMMISQNPTLSDCSSPRGINNHVVVSRDIINAHISKSTSLVDNTGLQISSPRNPGIRRRKTQAKKVVCVPAPASANGRPGGEVVPSDLWAWRKYGQKPIKGSPYPRGYYRCSSSKGCSARKQVERSRTDPNMLVITYTSEHNHPWPTQRNSLAGSTRSQASKNNSYSKTSTSSQSPKSTMKEEENNNVLSPSVAGCSGVKEESTEDMDKQTDMDDAEFGEDFSHGSYIPRMADSNHAGDFFADLCELESDPFSALFSQGLKGDQQKESKANIDPFSNLFD